MGALDIDSVTVDHSKAEPISIEKSAYTELRAELDRFQNKKPHWLMTFGGFVLSLLIFVKLGLLSWSVQSTAILVGVLLFHEGGHYLAMRAMGYENVRMYFVPFLGALTMGKPQEVSVPRAMFVSLMGPVPGIILGLVLLGIYSQIENLLLLQVASVLLSLNLLNLLPISVLDGGRVVRVLLSRRSPWISFVFDSLSMVGFIILLTKAHPQFAPFAGGLMAGIGASVMSTSVTNKIWKAKNWANIPDRTSELSDDELQIFESAIRDQFKNIKDTKRLARMVRQFHQRLVSCNMRKGRTAVQVALFVVYLASSAVGYWGLSQVKEAAADAALGTWVENYRQQHLSSAPFHLAKPSEISAWGTRRHKFKSSP